MAAEHRARRVPEGHLRHRPRVLPRGGAVLKTVRGDFDELLLAGYVPLGASGFALPCFAARPRANAWHVAVCAIDGDHRGEVVGFRPFDEPGVEHLRADLHRKVRVGDPWVDVFLLRGTPLVGTPHELMAELASVIGDAEAVAPISLLDLALAADDADVGKLAGLARLHVERAHGPEAAGRWRGGLMAAQVRLEVRRQMAVAGISGPLSTEARSATVEETATGLLLDLPDALVAALAAADAIEPLLKRIRLVGGRLGAGAGAGSGAPLDARLASRSSAATAPIVEPETGPGMEPATREEPARPAEQDDVEVSPAVRMLVVFSGTRARAIARHVTTPDWVPVRNGGSVARNWSVRRGGGEAGNFPVGLGSVVDVVPEARQPSSFSGYDVVVWVLDDGEVLNAAGDSPVMRLTGGGGPDPRALHLLAPAPPIYEPSKVLEDLASSGSSPFGADALIDTSIARSPFWTGNPSRAFDRRIADLVVESALVCSVDERLRDLLMRPGASGPVLARSAGPAHLLSLATERTVDGRAPEGTGFFSEATVRRLAGRPDRGHVFEFEVAPLRKAASRVRRGWVAAGPPAQDFGRFAHEAMARSARLARRFADDWSDTTADPDNELLDRNFVPDVIATVAQLKSGSADARSETTAARERNELLDAYRIEREDVPDEIASTLRAPGYVTGLSLGRRAPFVVTAETPNMKTLRAAARAGVPVVRYTDRETIEDLLEPGAAGMGPLLPREVRLPALARLESNRGLATRGVDPRDVLQLPPSRSEWGLSREASAAVSSLVRGYLARAGGEVEEVALPLAEVVGLVATGGSVAEELRKVLSLDSIGRRARLLKRPSDLRVAWAEPADGAARFVVEDGRFPIRVARLPQGVVPDQRLFMIDGDSAVPLLLGSRLFAVWARATTSRSTSWLSRFSVTGTFETLPIPPGLALRKDGVGRVGLMMAEGDSQLASIAEEIARDLDAGVLGREPEVEPDRSNPRRREADALLLAAIDLPVDATDVDVLDRMLSLNRQGSGTDEG